jgi:hypothetical protein
MIRDFANGETKRIVVDAEASHQMIESFVDRYVAEPRPRIERYQGQEPIFEAFGLEPQIHANLGRKVFLKSGGSLVIDQSEALTAIDVNTGRYVGKRDLEETVFKTNLEAIKEVVQQLRFRNIGGLIIIDLIDMESADHRDKVYRALREALRADKARTNILKISELGLVEMTRKRTRENLVQTLCEPCAYCEGKGYVLSSKSMAFRVVREIRSDLPRFCGRRVAVTVAPSVAEELLRDSSSLLGELGEELGRELEVRARPGLHQEQFEVQALDEGEPVEIALRWLEDPKERSDESEPAAEQENGGSRGGRRGRRRRGGRKRGGAPDGPGAENDSESEEDDATEAAEANGSPEGEETPPEEAAELAPSAMDAAAESADEATDAIGSQEPEAVDVEEESRILPPSSEDLADPGNLEESLELAPEVEIESEPEPEPEPETEVEVEKDDVPTAEVREDESSESGEDGTEDSGEKER